MPFTKGDRAKKLAILSVLIAGILLLIASGVALAVTKKCSGGECRGTTAGDVLYGTPVVDKIFGGKGDDTIYGGAAGDELRGGSGIDTLRGNAGNDLIYGGSGNDKISGKGGNDRLYGGYGNDNIHGSLDGQRDLFFCGPGLDQAVVGPGDSAAADCEIVKR